jgi:hypothetical protein
LMSVSLCMLYIEAIDSPILLSIPTGTT